MRTHWDFCDFHEKKNHHKPKTKTFIKKVTKTCIKKVKYVPIVKKHCFVDVKHFEVKKHSKHHRHHKPCHCERKHY